MQYISRYKSPMGDILMAGDETTLTGLWFIGQKHFARLLDKDHFEKETYAFDVAKSWLDVYFSGKEPDFAVSVRFTGGRFQKEVWELLCEIPYGETTTYGNIARRVAKKRGLERMSAQAVGQAVGLNEISIIIPCHRVVGSNGSLTGYAGGLDRKIKLLESEGVDIKRFFVPKNAAR